MNFLTGRLILSTGTESEEGVPLSDGLGDVWEEGKGRGSPRTATGGERALPTGQAFSRSRLKLDGTLLTSIKRKGGEDETEDPDNE
mmetsp:Transcript_24385/g.31077  ORF Transcript_24385/g.31077 Transcript_24385/m.31077 type:complete len:86 (-) Transcript_24385:11-268(-)